MANRHSFHQYLHLNFEVFNNIHGSIVNMTITLVWQSRPLHACLHSAQGNVRIEIMKTALMHTAFPLRISPSKQNNKVHAIPLFCWCKTVSTQKQRISNKNQNFSYYSRVFKKQSCCVLFTCILVNLEIICALRSLYVLWKCRYCICLYFCKILPLRSVS